MKIILMAAFLAAALSACGGSGNGDSLPAPTHVLNQQEIHDRCIFLVQMQQLNTACPPAL